MKQMSSKTDWIDELEESDDNETLFQEFISKLYKTTIMKEMGWAAAWFWIMSKLDDAEYTEEHSGPLSATDSKRLTDKRVKREP